MNQSIVDIWNTVARNFGKIGPKYWDYFGNRLIELSPIEDRNYVLDIGCGAGASLFPAARKVGCKGQVIGIDLAKGMVDVCHQRIQELGLDNVEVYEMDATKLTFDRQQFDLVINGFGLPYLYYMDKGFIDIKRVLKDNGALALVTWDEQEDNPWISGLIGKYLQPVQTQKDKQTNRYIKKAKEGQAVVEKEISLTKEEDLREIFVQAGFSQITITQEHKSFIYKDKDEWWAEMHANAVRGLLERIDLVGEGHLDAFKKEAYEGLEQFRMTEGIMFKRSVYYIVAVSR